MKAKVLTRTRKNAKTEFNGLPSRFKYKVLSTGAVYPYFADALNAAEQN